MTSTDPSCNPDPLEIGRRWPHPARVVLRNLLSLAVLIQTLSGLGGLSTSHVAISLVLMVVAIAGATTINSRREGDVLDHVALCVVVGAGAWLHVLTGNGQVFICGYTAVFVAMYFYGLPWGLVPAGLGVIALGLSTAYVGHYDPLGGIGQTVGAIGVGFAIAYRRRVVRASWQNRELAGELRDSREAEQRNAVAAERARLARELHDVLAHTLSSLSLHLESTRVLAKSRKTDSEVMDRIERAVSLARTGLEEARSAVGTLRNDALPGPDRLPALVADFGRDSDVAVEFHEEGRPRPLAAESRVALFRTAQEALTNVAKHAAASRVEVGLTWASNEVVLVVTDDGRGLVASSTGGGNGLRGMRERAELAGGQLDVGPGESGYVVSLRLPLEASTGAPVAMSR